jgi:hypothetical protein
MMRRLDKIIGLKKKIYAFYPKKKLIQPSNLDTSALITSYILDEAKVVSFEVSMEVLDALNKEEFDNFVEVRVYEKLNLDKEYVIKYKLVKSENRVTVYAVAVAKNELRMDVLVDYVSFIPFGYGSLYKEMLEKSNDLFVGIGLNAIFFTFYSNGKFLHLEVVDKVIDEEDLVNIIESIILKIGNLYKLEVKRVFINKDFDRLKALMDVFVDKLDFRDYKVEKIDEFLAICMFDGYYAFRDSRLEDNFSIYTRPLLSLGAKYFLFLLLSILGFSIYPLYLYVKSTNLEKENKILEEKIKKQSAIFSRLESKLKVIDSKIEKRKANRLRIERLKKIIDNLYAIKFNYLPVSKELVDFVRIFYTNGVFLEAIRLTDGWYNIKVSTNLHENILRVLRELKSRRYVVSLDKVVLKNGKYFAFFKVKR